MQKRRYTFTWNNYPENGDDWKKCLERCKSSYLVCGLERAPTTGTKHLQGYFEFKSGKNSETIIKKCPGIYLIPSVGSAEQNRIYCTKSENYYETGEISVQGKRTDIHAALDDVRNGLSELEMFEEHPGTMCRYPKSLERYRLLLDKKKSKGYHKKTVKVYYGKTGTGKTHSAMDEFPDACIVSQGVTGFWWNDYDGEECVVMDEFRGTIPLSQLLRILDGYSCTVDVKGGTKQLKANTIIITSNVHPRDWYKNADIESIKALFRRLNEIRYFYDFLKFNLEDTYF